jgi:16S rRNA (cytosine1402-N4)-methyltransferase
MAKRKNSTRRRLDRERAAQSERKDYEYHLPVMLDECCDWLITDRNGLYADGTLGGGGHTAEILKRLDVGGRLISFDADPVAIQYCTAKFSDELAKGEESKLILRHANFFEACSTEEIHLRKVNGLLLDLGVSSRQLDTEHRGFSYRANTRLDMRFGTEGRSAEEIINTAEEDELERILRNYGEEPFARAIARRIVERRRAVPLQTTQDLRFIVEETTPQSTHAKTLARVFQAIRIAVNRELEILEGTLRGIIPLLAPHGRIVVMSYHSLEDRIVKTVFKEESEKDFKDSAKQPLLKILTPKPILPSQKEIEENPRARSAKLRVAERTSPEDVVVFKKKAKFREEE